MLLLALSCGLFGLAGGSLLRVGVRRVRGVHLRRPLVEVLTGGLCVVLALRLGADPALPAYLYLAAVGVALALVDVATHKLPDVLTLPSYVVVAALLGLATALGSDSGDLVRALLGGLAMYACYLALCLAHPAGMGFGDVKLAGVLGMATGWLGWGAWVVGLAGGVLLGGLFGIGLIVLRRGSRRTAVPYGPFLLAGALLAVLYGPQLARAYVSSAVG